MEIRARFGGFVQPFSTQAPLRSIYKHSPEVLNSRKPLGSHRKEKFSRPTDKINGEVDSISAQFSSSLKKTQSPPKTTTKKRTICFSKTQSSPIPSSPLEGALSLLLPRRIWHFPAPEEPGRESRSYLGPATQKITNNPNKEHGNLAGTCASSPRSPSSELTNDVALK